LSITDEELEIMNLIDKSYSDYPFYGVRKIAEQLRRQSARGGSIYNHKSIYRLMQLMGIGASYQGRI
jgi:putative transposase